MYPLFNSFIPLLCLLNGDIKKSSDYQCRSILLAVRLLAALLGDAISRLVRLGWDTKAGCSCVLARPGGIVTTRAERLRVRHMRLAFPFPIFI